ncbi:mechanosensitive ion channel family protein [Porphyrobacter sp. AAP60]|uniref:mechanosensitive ion channel family protein n=1 Tax=Porphyrobacter sp. AAP60 TaxID=1523423 RepID=UPI0006B984B9|nr:mechanosensitive ion channel domain-containing protein [Porphyrobacter sp. AAP60]KPF61905.1 mechanosensitive ion channel protein [Porphyrobacter sp. AAP60]
MTAALSLPEAETETETETPPDPAATASPVPEASPEAAASEPAVPEAIVSGADSVRQDIAGRSQTIGDILDQLDSLALSVGDWRISAFDVLFAVAAGLLVLGFAVVATRLMRSALRRITSLDSTQRVLAEKIAQIVIWVTTFFIGIDLLGIDLTALAVFSGAFGLAIGFGLQKTFGNLISGIILLLDKSIKPGDVIAVADQSGQQTFGQIRKIGIRAISVVTRDEREYLIPNENLMINQVENWSYSSRNVRIQIPVGVSYNTDMMLAEKLMLEAAGKSKRVLETPPPTVWWGGFGDNSVDFTIHCWISDPEQGVGNVRSEVLKGLWWLFKENDIEIPYPQRDINLRDNAQMQALIAALGGRLPDASQDTSPNSGDDSE